MRPEDFSEEFRARYQLHDVLGAGGMAVVYRATQTSLDRPVAVKVLDALGFDEGEALTRFDEEARVASHLDHPNLVRLIDHGRDGDLAYMVYELVDGQDLGARIQEAPQGARKGLPLEEVVAIARDLARGLAYAHKVGVVHRDLKPANILLTKEGAAKIADFGLARLEGMTREAKTRTGMVVGTPECMAPEQARGKPVGPPADVYSFGILVYWMLAGRPPFVGENAGEVMVAHLKKTPRPLVERRPNLPPGLYEVVDATLARKPEDRPTAADVVRAMGFVEGLGEGARSQVQKALGTTTKLSAVSGGAASRGRLVAGVAAALLGVAGAVWWATPAPRPEDPRVVAAPSRLRAQWKVAAAEVQWRVAGSDDPWQAVPGHREGDGWIAEVEGVPAETELEWRLVSGGEPGLERTVRTPARVEVAGPWPKFNAAGAGLGWLVNPKGDATLVQADGQHAQSSSDGLTFMEPGVYSILYEGGLADVGSRLDTVPSLDEGVAGLRQALQALDPRAVVGKARLVRKGVAPSLAARRAALEVYGRLRGLDAALASWVAVADPRVRLELYRELSRADLVDRVLRNEGFQPAFDVQEALKRCLTFSCVARQYSRESGPRPEIRLVTDYARRRIPVFEGLVPPRKPLPEGDAAVEVRIEVRMLPAHHFLELEVAFPDRRSDGIRLPIRPPLRKDRFNGEISVLVPAAVAPEGASAWLHVQREDLPGSDGAFELPRFPLFQAEEGDRTDLHPSSGAFLVDWSLNR